MDIAQRLKAERERLGLTQTEFAALGGVGRKTQFNYEAGERAPDAVYLAAVQRAGVDVLYVVSGEHAGGVAPAPTLSPDEVELLQLFRAAPLAVKAAAIGALSSADARSARPQPASPIRQVNNAPHGIQVGAGKVVVKKGSR